MNIIVQIHVSWQEYGNSDMGRPFVTHYTDYVLDIIRDILDMHDVSGVVLSQLQVIILTYYIAAYRTVAGQGPRSK